MRGVEAKQRFSTLKDFQTSRGMGKTIPAAEEPAVLHAYSFAQRMMHREEYLHFNTAEKLADKPTPLCCYPYIKSQTMVAKP
jgi:hypothetical protein